MTKAMGSYSFALSGGKYMGGEIQKRRVLDEQSLNTYEGELNISHTTLGNFIWNRANNANGIVAPPNMLPAGVV